MKNLLLLSAAALLTSCSCDRRPAYVEQGTTYDATPGTTVVQPQPVYGGGGATVIHDNDNSGALVNGLILGHMLSGSGSNNSGGGYSSKRTKKTIINNYHAPAAPRPTYRSSYSAPSRPSYSAPARSSYRPSTFRSSSSMGSRAVRRR